jgi:hypothetical protein
MSEATETKAPVWTQQMVMHLNGGSKFSQLNYDLFRDGENTGIVRITRTNGSPKYLNTIDKFIDSADGDSEFDVLATRGVGMKEWLEGQIAKRLAAQPEQEHT